MLTPETVQTDELLEVNVIVRPELAVALSGGGDEPMFWPPRGPKVMVWLWFWDAALIPTKLLTVLAALSVTVKTLKLGPVVVGVPVIRPVAGLRDRPG